MQSVRRAWSVLLVLTLLAACTAASGGREAAETTDTGRPTLGSGDTALTDGGADATSSDAGSGDADADGSNDTEGGPDAEPATLLDLALFPTRIDLATELGVGATETLLAIGAFSDGSERDVGREVLWTTTDPSVATVDVTGRVATAGSRAGRCFVVGSLDGLEVSAEVTVTLQEARTEGAPTAEDVSLLGGFAAEDAASAPLWLYPQSGTVFPSRMLPPLFQWDRRGCSAARISLAAEGVAIAVITDADQFAPSEAEWTALASGFGEVTTRLEAVCGGRLLAAIGPSFRMADAGLRGSVYYWRIASGDIMRIRERASAPERVFPDNVETGTCRGCHTISPDGSRLAFMYNGGENPRAGIATAESPTPPVIPNGSLLQWTWASFRPDGRRLVGVMSGRMSLYDVTPGIPDGALSLGEVASANAGKLPAQPAWSPDGSRLAFVSRNNPALDWEFGASSLHMVPYDRPTDSFGAAVELVARGTGASDDTISTPTWSPDSQWIAFVRGEDAGRTGTTQLQLYHLPTGSLSTLARAGSGLRESFTSFSPYREGGYFWLLFYSTRSYGHVTTNKQLWVAAIDANAPPGSDLSFPAFWLPGQDSSSTNISGYWSPPACGTLGQLCKDDTDCCGDSACLAGPGPDETTCQPAACVAWGDGCSGADRCCLGGRCAPNLDGSNVCQPALGD